MSEYGKGLVKNSSDGSIVFEHQPGELLEKFGDGPWIGEPRKVQWIDPETSLDCLIVRNGMGNLCGYVGVPSSHPYHKVSYKDIVDIDTHGGLTFSDMCDEEYPDGICHVPMDGRPGDVWWLGFDCGHSYDVSPRMRKDFELINIICDICFSPNSGLKMEYRTVEYVKETVTKLSLDLSKINANNQH